MSRLSITSLSKSFNKVKAVDDLTLDLPGGEIFVLLGPNGAGKTTTMKLVVGLLRPDQGEVLIDRVDVQKHPEQAKAKLGYISDNPFIYRRLTGREFLHFVGGIFSLPKKTYESKIEAILEMLEVGPWIDLPSGEYSHGMRQKVILAQALLHDPLLYLIDEPLVGLDPKSSKDVKLIIRRERDRGKTFLISTHLLGLTDEIADRVGIIDQGRLRFVGTIKELKEQAGEQDLEEVYLKMTRQGDTGTGSPAATT